MTIQSLKYPQEEFERRDQIWDCGFDRKLINTIMK